MKNLKVKLIFAIGYLVGRHYGRQQGFRPKRVNYVPGRSRATVRGTIREAIVDVTSKKITEFIYSKMPKKEEFPLIREADPELEALLDEEERIARERDESHSGNYGPNGI